MKNISVNLYGNCLLGWYQTHLWIKDIINDHSCLNITTSFSFPNFQDFEINNYKESDVSALLHSFRPKKDLYPDESKSILVRRKILKSLHNQSKNVLIIEPWLFLSPRGLLKKNALIEYPIKYVNKHKDCTFIPLGHAFEMYDNNQDEKVYGNGIPYGVPNHDGHVTQFGAYMLACLFYIAFTGKSPVGLPHPKKIHVRPIVYDTRKREHEVHKIHENILPNKLIEIQTICWDVYNRLKDNVNLRIKLD
jgi:hypothetical protein